MAKICLCLIAKTLSRNMEILEENRKYIDIAELRVDCLYPDERLHIRRFPEMAGLPVILSIRRAIDGGGFVSGEGSRIKLFAKGLAYAEANRRLNFAYLDIEGDLDVPSLEEVARTYGTKIIRSIYNTDGVNKNLAGKLKKMLHSGDELAKALVKPLSLEDVARIYDISKETSGINKILSCTGSYGDVLTILPKIFGSKISYTYAEDNASSGLSGINSPGISPKEINENYRLREISENTKIFAISGFPLENSGGTRFFNTLFNIEKTDAVCVPMPADSAHSLIHLAEKIGISGISISAPHSVEILSCLDNKSEDVHSIGSCNTIIPGCNGWKGYNTDKASFSDSFLEFYGKKDLRRRRVTIIGAGGIARAVAAEVMRLKGRVLILNRTPAHARRIAEPFKFAWAGLDSIGAALMEKYSEIIIQTSSAGMHPNTNADPVGFYEFSGKETVMDVIYKPEKTLFLKRAEAAGCRVLNGYDMLYKQIMHQYRHFMNREFPPSLVPRVDFISTTNTGKKYG